MIAKYATIDASERGQRYAQSKQLLPETSASGDTMSFACARCITDPFLVSLLDGHPDACDYCDGPGPTVTIQDVAEASDQVLRALYTLTNDTMAVTVYDHDPPGTDLFWTLKEMDFATKDARGDALVQDVAEWLVDKWDDFGDPHFMLRSDLGPLVSDQWSEMQDSLRHEARHLNPEVSRVLKLVFGSVHRDRTRDNSSVIVEAGPGTSIARLLRARSFESDAELQAALQHPAKSLGTRAAGSAGASRMNSQGLPAFYGATDASVAIAEVRPPVGARVAVAAFNLIRPVSLLDLRKLREVRPVEGVSPFHPGAIVESHRRAFLRKLVSEITLPVMPGRQDVDYLITQVIADYLATHEGGALDGIIFPSVQKPDGDMAGDFNVVLFPRASLVEGSDGPDIANASLWDYYDEHDMTGEWFSPEIWIGPEQGTRPAAEVQRSRGLEPHNSGVPSAKRNPALRIDLSSIVVHHIEGVSFKTSSTAVRVIIPSPQLPPSGSSPGS